MRTLPGPVYHPLTLSPVSRMPSISGQPRAGAGCCPEQTRDTWPGRRSEAWSLSDPFLIPCQIYLFVRMRCIPSKNRTPFCLTKAKSIQIQFTFQHKCFLLIGKINVQCMMKQFNFGSDGMLELHMYRLHILHAFMQLHIFLTVKK